MQASPATRASASADISVGNAASSPLIASTRSTRAHHSSHRFASIAAKFTVIEPAVRFPNRLKQNPERSRNIQIIIQRLLKPRIGR